MNHSLSIIMPALNMEHLVSEAIATTSRALQKAALSDYEIIVLVNTSRDGSHDRTDEVVLNLAKTDSHIRPIINHQFKPFGLTYWQGVDLAQKENVMFIPSDDETMEDSMVGIFNAMGQANLVIPYTANPKARSFKRRFVSRGFVILCNFLFGLHLKYYNGTCIIPTKFIRKVPLRSESFAYMVQVLVLLLRSGATYIEVPMGIKPTSATASFKLKSVVEAVNALIILFWMVHIKGVRIYG